MPHAALPESHWRLAEQGASILCVEDDDDTRLLLVEVLTSEGYEVTDAATVEEGLLALAEAGGFDLILTDYSLPDGTGTSMLQEARERGLAAVGTPVILFTAESLPWRLAGMTLARKPLVPDVLLALVRDMLAAVDARMRSPKEASPLLPATLG